MFDISALKEMKLSELQAIAKAAKTIKFNGVKRNPIGKILEHQTAKADPSLDFKWNHNWRMINQKRAVLFPPKAAIQKLKYSVYNNEPATVVTV
jgi:transcription termination factor Rho